MFILAREGGAMRQSTSRLLWSMLDTRMCSNITLHRAWRDTLVTYMYM
jgi:hypothetical protein